MALNNTLHITMARNLNFIINNHCFILLCHFIVLLSGDGIRILTPASPLFIWIARLVLRQSLNIFQQNGTFNII